MVLREIVLIDEELCDGCGLCIPSCEEGALKIVDGKARLIGDKLCDGLGACLGECPQDAISIEKREAIEFDQEAVNQHLKEINAFGKGGTQVQSCSTINIQPKSAKTMLKVTQHNEEAPSRLTQWPVKVQLVHPQAPFLNNGSDLLIAADCVPFAMGAFHSKLLNGKIVIAGCPKLDDQQAYFEKLTEIFTRSRSSHITVAHMEVPCCHSLFGITQKALKASGKTFSISRQVISVNGNAHEG